MKEDMFERKIAIGAVSFLRFRYVSVTRLLLSVGLLFGVMIVMAPGQSPASNEPGVSYGGIEISPEGVKAIALRAGRNEEVSGPKLVYSEIIRIMLWRTAGGEFAPRASADAAQAVSMLLNRLRRDYRVSPERTYIIGSSRLGADHPADLEGEIRSATGLTLTFLDLATELQLCIAGTIPRLGREGEASIDNRTTSALIEIGFAGAQGGYELLRHSKSGTAVFDTVSMSIPQGGMTYANEINRAVGENSDLPAFMRQIKASRAINFRQALRREIEIKPGMLHRKRVFLTGGVVWAMATLLFPEDRQNFISITYEDIVKFADKAARSPREIATPNLSVIRDRKLRTDIEQEVEAVRTVFRPKQLIASAELLRAAAEELRWQDKKIWYFRFGHLGCILSYIRLQIGQ